jgi:RND family efflux transporter MFP subunit
MESASYDPALMSLQFVDTIRKGVIMDHRAEGRRWGVRFFALTAALPLAFACLLIIGCDKQEQEAPEIIRPVQMMTIGAASAGGVREFPGQVRAAEEIELSFEVSGRIIELNAREGSTVARGALVAALDPLDFEAGRDRELARLNEKRADFQRNQALYERDAISLRDLEVVRRQFEVAEANLRQAEKALGDTRLYAPFDGKIAGRLVENRENIQAKQPVVAFHDDSSLEIRASFPETDFLRIRDLGTVQDMTKQLKPTVEISAVSGSKIDAWVKEIRTTADPVTRTYDVVLGFDPPAGTSVTSGMTARLTITLSATEGALLIPSAAVISDSEHQSRVWVYDEATGAVHAQKVVAGNLIGDEIEILSGLEDGLTIAILGASNLTEGMKVRPLGD